MMNFIKNIGTTEIVIIFLVVLLLFGGKKLNELARGLGESTKEAKKVKDELIKAKAGSKDANEPEEAEEEDSE